jgi:hypothetical protein
VRIDVFLLSFFHNLPLPPLLLQLAHLLLPHAHKYTAAKMVGAEAVVTTIVRAFIKKKAREG